MPLDKSLRVGDPICIAATGDRCGEGILWEAVTECIYWTDINRFLVHRYRFDSAEVKTWFFDEPVTCVLSTNRRDTLALVQGSGVALWEPAGDIRHERLFSLPGWPVVRCNDAGIDPRGAIWLGSMRNNVKENGESVEVEGFDGVLYQIGAGGGWSEQRLDVGISNTLLWSPDSSRFYFGDSLRNEIWAYDYDRVDGSIRNEVSFFHSFHRGLPDGSALDHEGYLWNCRYGGGCIVRVSPDGQIDRVIEMPVANPTNCTFGGKDGSTLLVTCASPVPGQWERFGGCLFALETNVAGSPSNAFRCF